MPKVAAVPRGTLVIRVLSEDRLECVGVFPACSHAADPALASWVVTPQVLSVSQNRPR